MDGVRDARLLTPAEFEVLEALWQSPEDLTVGHVRQYVQSRRPVAYTTVMTVLDKLSRKGSVARRKRGKAYLYSPRVARRDVLQALIEDFASHYFGSSQQALRDFLDGHDPMPVAAERANPPVRTESEAALEVELL